MLYKHFNDIKPVSIIKFSTDKKCPNKKFAFVYFRTPEDAKEVKTVIDSDYDQEEKAIANKASQSDISKLGRRHRILKKAFRVSFLAVNRTSKLILRPKSASVSTGYFNSRNIEREIKRVLAPYQDFKLNKVVVPKNPKDANKDLEYARVFFDLKEQKTIDDIKEILEKDDEFTKNISVDPFNPPPKYSNMLYINNFVSKGEKCAGLEQ